MGCPPGVLDQRLLRDNEMVLLEGTSWKHQAHEAVGAFRLIRKSLSCEPGEIYERPASLRMASDSAAGVEQMAR